MWYNNKFFRYSAGLLLVLLILFMFGQISFILDPLKGIAAAILIPVFISMLLYYMLRPLVRLLEKIRFPRLLAIAASMIVLAAVLAGIGTGIGSMASDQVSELVKNLPGYYEVSKDKIIEFVSSNPIQLINPDQLQSQFTGLLDKVVPFLTQGLFSGISIAANITTSLLLVPFILFYLLKDDKLFSKSLLSVIPQKYRDRSTEIIDNIDKSLSAYIVGQMLVASISCVAMYLGYLILGLKYSMILALFVFLTSFIPIVGAFIGITPAILVGFTSNDPYMTIKLIVLMFIVQQIESNFTSPQIMGKRMNIHPLTFIILLIAAASLYGFVGMLIAVPVYVILKVLVRNLYELYKLRKAA